jgi:hypothetical protein
MINKNKTKQKTDINRKLKLIQETKAKRIVAWNENRITKYEENNSLNQNHKAPDNAGNAKKKKKGKKKNNRD